MLNVADTMLSAMCRFNADNHCHYRLSDRYYPCHHHLLVLGALEVSAYIVIDND